MTNPTKILMTAILASLISGCATKVPLTRSLMSKYSVQEQDLPSLQYFVSSKVAMSREERTISRDNQKGALKGREHIFIEDVSVDPLTPGIAEQGSFSDIYVSFEEGSQFRFSLASDERYYLQADRELKGDEVANIDKFLGRYAFAYRNKEYYSRDIKGIHLLVNKSDLLKVDREAHKMKGRRVNSQ